MEKAPQPKQVADNCNYKPETYYYCGFKCHVQDATIVIAAAGVALTVVLLLTMARLNCSVFGIMFVLIVFVSYALVLIANYVNLPNLYWLHLVTNPVCVGLIVACLAYPALIVLFDVDPFPTTTIPRDHFINHLLRVMALAKLVVSIVGAVVLAYCQSVVYRSFRWMRKRRIQIGHV